MSNDAQALIASYLALPPADRHEAAVAILRQATDVDLPTLSDDQLTRVADDLFAELDAREAADGA